MAENLESIFPGESEMARRMRAFDWSQNPLGPPQSWPQNLKTCVRIILTSRHPMFVWWGEQLIHFYNDGYAAFLHAKHPRVLGLPAHIVWEEVWPVLGPRVEFAMQGTEGTYDEALMLILLRKGYPEEMYVTFSYSPVLDDDGGVGGIICPATEETERIIGERQMALLRELGTRTADARTYKEATELASSALRTNPVDLPFALIYLIDPEKRSASLIEAYGISHRANVAPDTVALDAPCLWPLDEVSRTHRACLAPDLAVVTNDLPVAHGYRVTKALAMPLTSAGDARAPGVLVTGLNPLRSLDDGYQRFLDLVAGGVSAAITNAQAYEAERRRAEALAELDRAKTAFFSNVSHEFRTPLTLILGPVEEALAEPQAKHQRERLELLHRNALRLQKLVNTLLDFSRIEAGRAQASYEPTPLDEFTAELASAFRSAIEKTGMRLVVDCPPLPEPVYVDRDMFEKIVLNLLSNAFKFTFAGEIAVTLRDEGNTVELSVRDTGTGIAEEQLPHIFERFHRIEGARGRTHEGTGIGLALVQELVKLHGGSVGVASVVGKGSTFTVTLPKGTAHLPADRIGAARRLSSTALTMEHFLEEAGRWLPDGIEKAVVAAGDIPADVRRPQPAEGPSARIVWADDNADMRDYVSRLLAPLGEVEAVPDGEAALAAVHRRIPDLILADVMMPGMDGFGLLRALRACEHTRSIPVVLLSARAGEESRVEGMEAGADDYLVKPFSARELVARVDAHLKMARLRTEGEKALRESEAKLEMELADTRELQRISSSLIPENNVDLLYDDFLTAARSLMRSDMASIQMLSPESQALFLLAQKGFAPESAKFWEWVKADDRTSCSLALARGEAVTIPDVELWDLLKGTEDLSHFRLSGIRAVLSVPLISRDGRLVGVISTHWRQVHQASERELRLLEVLARQAADVIERRRAEERQSLLMSELNHRVKNTLATVQAIASQTLRGSTDPQQFVVGFQARLHALSRAHNLLTRSNWESANIVELVREQLAMDGDIGRIRLHGPEALLTPQSSVALSLVLHELGTNARKYGALSVPEGRLDVRWSIGAQASLLQINWTEMAGPPVVEPQKRGFGATLIEKSLGGVGGSAALRFHSEGLHCAIRLPLSPIVTGNGRQPEVG